MTAWILIGYLAWGTTAGGGGPFTAEFTTEAACRKAIEEVTIAANNARFASTYSRFLICVPKGVQP